MYPSWRGGYPDGVSDADVDAETPDRAWLRVYVNDHRAGAEAGIALMERCRGSNEGSPLAALLAELVAELREDREALAAVAQSLDLAPNPMKPVLARVAEVVGRLKLNGRLTSYSPTSRLLELEALLAGIDAKRSLWGALDAAGISPPPGVRFAHLADRATEQRRRLVPHHAEAARVALAAGSPQLLHRSRGGAAVVSPISAS